MNTLQQLRTVIKYPGAKWRIADWIIGHMPEHHSYLEPYFGSGGVFFRKPASHIETINDIDGDVVNLFRCIREDAEKLAMLIEVTPYAREEYYTAFNSLSEDPFERARLFLMKTWMGHGFRTFCKSGWKNDIAGRENSYAVEYWNRLPKWVMEIVSRLKEVQIENKPALELIQRFNRPNVLIYADPPYLLSTRKMKKQYAYEMTDADHEEMLEALRDHQGPVLLSGYDNDMYNDILQGWTKTRLSLLQKKVSTERKLCGLNLYQMKICAFLN